MAHPLRKTLEYLGLVEESAPEAEETPARPTPTTAAPVHKANVTPIRRAPGKVTETLNEIVTVHPKRYSDVQHIASSFRDGIPVIINLSQMSEPDARRLIDFASGLAEGLLGKIERVTPKVFLLSPAHVAISNEDAPVEDQATPEGFFN